MLNNKILIVDDNLVNRQYFSMSLNKSGFQVAVAKSGFEAIEIAKNTPFGVILMDIRMPDMDGYETTKRIRVLEIQQQTAIVATSAENISKQNQEKFEDFLLKPVTPKQLEQIILKFCPDCGSDIKIFNQEGSLEYAFNDKDVMHKLIGLFITDLPVQIQQISVYLDDDKQLECRNLIHKIRGSCKACGADDLDKKLVSLSNNLDSHSHFDKLKIAVTKYLLAVNSL